MGVCSPAIDVNVEGLTAGRPKPWASYISREVGYLVSMHTDYLLPSTLPLGSSVIVWLKLNAIAHLV